MKGTFEYRLRNGSICKIEAEYECIMEMETLGADGWEIPTEEKPTDVASSLVAYVDGKKVDSSRDKSFWGVVDMKEGVKKIWGLKIGFANPEDAGRYEEWIARIIEDGKSDEVKAYEKAEKEKKAKEKFEMAKKTVAKAESQKDIPTREEAKRRMKQYNNTINEGGEGYIPYIVNKEEYEEALKIIEEGTR